MDETWKDIIGYETSYEVSTYGNIRSKNRHIAKHWSKHREFQLIPYRSRVIKQRIGLGNYYIVKLSVGGNRKVHYVHRLVALVFIDNSLNKCQVNHIDGNKHNNRADNLEWVTDKENKKHCRDNNLQRIAKGTDFKSTKLTDEKVIQILTMSKRGFSTRKIAMEFNVCQQTINKIVLRRLWKHIPEPMQQMTMEL